MPEVQETNFYKRIMAYFRAMKELRRPFEQMWEQIIELLRADLSLWKDTEISDQGKKPNLTVFNAAPQEALENWADGMQGHLASSSLDWFVYRMGNKKLDKNAQVRKWLQGVEEVVYGLMRNSNYYSHLGPLFRDAGSIGDAPSWIEENSRNDGLACSNFHPREIYVDEDSAGNVDTFYRHYQLTARNAVELFGKELLSETLQKASKKDPLKRFNFIHACHKRTHKILDGIPKVPDRPWISIYLQEEAPEDKQKPLRIAGYFSKPFSYWRFAKSPGSVYGVGLGCFALVDIFGINSITEVMLRAGHLAVEPPMYAHAEMRTHVQLGPGGFTWGSRPEHKPEPINTDIKYPYGADREDRAAAAIDRWFNVDFFLMLARTEKTLTATEVVERANERGIMLAPKIGRLNNDLFNPHHDRIFDIAWRNNWIDQPPDIILEQSNGRIEVEYNGLLERAQRQQREIRRTQVVLGQTEPIVAMKPDVLDFADFDKSFVRIMRDGSWPEEEIRTEEAVAGIRQQRVAAQQAQMQMQMLQEAAKTAPSLQKETKPTSPLAALTGAGK